MNNSKKMTYAVWTVRVLLAALFLFAGVMKLVMSAEALSQGPVAFPEWFIRFIGVAEVAGALGLILPSALRIRPRLTVYAAAGLALIMIGAVITTIATGPAATATIPLVTGVLAAFVAYQTRALA